MEIEHTTSRPAISESLQSAMDKFELLTRCEWDGDWTAVPDEDTTYVTWQRLGTDIITEGPVLAEIITESGHYSTDRLLRLTA